MGKEPSFQYYPKDWRADAVFGCSLAARGLWHEMMNMMHTGEQYGYLSINGLPIPDEMIATYCGASLAEYQTLLSELERARVPRRTSNGIIFSKRMVEDAKKRSEWRKQKQNQRVKTCPQDVREMSAPIPSPSPSPPSNTKPKKEIAPPEFSVFWDSYPRKEAKIDATRAFVRKGCASILGEVLAGLTAWKQSDQWQDVGFVPHPATWLNREAWKETPVRKAGIDERELERVRQLRR